MTSLDRYTCGSLFETIFVRATPPLSFLSGHRKQDKQVYPQPRPWNLCFPSSHYMSIPVQSSLALDPGHRPSYVRLSNIITGPELRAQYQRISSLYLSQKHQFLRSSSLYVNCSCRALCRRNLVPQTHIPRLRHSARDPRLRNRKRQLLEERGLQEELFLRRNKRNSGARKTPR